MVCIQPESVGYIELAIYSGWCLPASRQQL